jgi:amino acid adenylation domain-containing protein
MINPFNKPEIPASNPEQQLRGEESLTDAQRHKLLVEWNNTTREYPQDKCIHQLFEEQVERSPDAIAVVFEEEHLTYRELNQRANCLAHHLKTLGVGPEVLVGICVERSLEMIVAILGILKAGAAYVPLDPEYPQERLDFILEDTQVSVLLTQRSLREKLPQYRGNIVYLDTEWLTIARESAVNLVNAIKPENLAYIIYTSGSTGKPKGVMIPHQGICNFLLWMRDNYQLTTNDRVLQKTSYSFDLSIGEFFLPLLAGACLVFARPGGQKDSAYLVELINAHKITTILFVPSMLAILIEQQAIETCCSLKQVICCGEALPLKLQERFFDRLKTCELHNSYGPTEASVAVTFWKCQRNSNQRVVPIGRPISNTQIYLLDSNLQPVPVGVEGELHIGGVCLAKGYLNRPDLTAEKFIFQPFSDDPDARLYKTGDLARYLPDGNIEYVGRIDHQVKIHGFRIELGEIEAALLQHPEVRDAVVIVREDTYGDKRLAAYIVSQSQISTAPAMEGDSYAEHISHWQTLYEKTDSQTPTHHNQNFNINQPLQGKVAQKLIPLLRSFLQEKLPDYMVPNAFMLLDTLPLTPNGKIDRHSLPVPDYTRINLPENFVAPSTPVEKVLAQIWSQVLGIEQVGIYDKFLELGGHSLLATQIVSRLRDTLKVELPISSLLSSPTIAELALCINEADAGEKPKNLASPIQRVSRNQKLPLSWNQQQLWFLSQLELDTPVYNEPSTIRFPGAMNVDALLKALNEIIKRHESLRTRFLTVDEQPVQVIDPPSAFNLTVVDLRQLPQEEREAEALRLATLESKRVFDLTTGPLLRATLIQLADEEYRLFLTFHHIIIDGFSLYNVFAPELAALYEAFSNNKPSLSLRHAKRTQLAELPVQYADFAIWQQQRFTEEILDRQLNYWKQQLADLPVLQLPYDRPRSSVHTFRGARQCLALSKNLTSALKALSQREGVTLYMTLLAAFKTLLYRYTSSEDIVVGTVSAGRNRPELEGLIGYFPNTLVLRTDLSGSPSFRQLLGRVREVTMGAYAHEDLPYLKLVQTLQPERNLSQNPLFQVAFVLEPPMPSLDLGWSISQLDIQTDAAKFDLTLELDSGPQGIIGRLEYNTDLFDERTISRMIGHFQTLLKGIVANPIARISELPLLTEAERYQLLVEWNNTVKEYPRDKCIHQLFEEQVERSPDAIAVVFEDKQLTYLQLNQRANKIAHHLRTLGVGPKVLVGICVERSLEMVVGLLGILKAGGAYVPLDPEYPTERLSFILQDAQVSVLLTQQRLVEKLPEYKAQFVYLDTDWQVISRSSEENPITGVQATNLAYVIYTSGSTGQPKGVAMNHFSLCNLILWQLQNTTISSGSKTLQFAPVSFDVSFQEMFSTWCSGGTLLLIAEELRRDPLTLLGLLQEKAVERLFIPFVGLQQIAEVATGSELVTSYLREIITAGEQLQITPAISNWLSKLTDCTLHNHYGPSESHVVTTFTLTNSVDNWPLLPPIGRPIANTQIYILDSHLQPVPISVPGELYIGGAGLARGYLNRPELTQHKFIPNPFSTDGHSRLYKTGDLARYLPDGNIEYLGRIDNQVKVRGFRIELGEIEAVLSQHPYVRSAVAIAREDKLGVKHLFAYVLPDIKQPTSNELYFFLKQKLPDYMMPASFTFLQAFPLSPNGKVDRQALPIPDAGRPELSQTFVAPSTATEELLAEIWSEILGIEKIGIHDNFFDLGGHSLRVIQVVSRIRQTFDLEISVHHLFKNHTISKLIEVMTELAGSFEVIDEIARTIIEISQLSPEQVQAMLALTQENG